MSRAVLRSANGRLRPAGLLVLLVVLPCATPCRAGELAALCVDRAAIERVYHAQRTGVKTPFDQVMPANLVERLVRTDLLKEAALRQAYGVEVSPAMLEAEVSRIDATSRAPEMLAEIKAALGNDPVRFARSFAKPILVDRILRTRFDDDDDLHAQQRALAVRAREDLLGGSAVADMNEVTWLLTLRPVDDGAASPAVAPPPVKGEARSNTYAIESTVQVAQVVSSPDSESPESRKLYLEDLDPRIQAVLLSQLHKAGDVSAVIETSQGFIVFVARERTPSTLAAASLAIPKRNFEEWLAGQQRETGN